MTRTEDNVLKFEADEIEIACRLLQLSKAESSQVGEETARLTAIAAECGVRHHVHVNIKVGLSLTALAVAGQLSYFTLSGPLVVNAFREPN